MTWTYVLDNHPGKPLLVWPKNSSSLPVGMGDLSQTWLRPTLEPVGHENSTIGKNTFSLKNDLAMRMDDTGTRPPRMVKQFIRPSDHTHPSPSEQISKQVFYFYH
jgi:hypothetical protein